LAAIPCAVSVEVLAAFGSAGEANPGGFVTVAPVAAGGCAGGAVTVAERTFAVTLAAPAELVVGAPEGGFSVVVSDLAAETGALLLLATGVSVVATVTSPLAFALTGAFEDGRLAFFVSAPKVTCIEDGTPVVVVAEAGADLTASGAVAWLAPFADSAV
jgi:hypothetical protein